MLYLNRLPGQSILIGDGIEVRLVSVHRGMARIGVDAPHDTVVDRAEVREKRIKNPDDPRGADCILGAGGRTVRVARCMAPGCSERRSEALESVYCWNHSVELAARIAAREGRPVESEASSC